ncbi:hypothetical protein OV203_14315 [Nannocystis sp. ILAH1]|uniref:tetratricopeptide repeat protein n=1 Tax=unclassified Nannocystis TaxID=2627009 RepID=UPI00226DAEAD|nr:MULTISPECIES: hypothetical protein [unclassified Nannocystis]MCY0988302.1 hypothetical protein [Nannocystis sp. ILAH1]MCY1067737.1 hypothetical protein [Nannocystis sp. RBIL2]
MTPVVARTQEPVAPTESGAAESPARESVAGSPASSPASEDETDAPASPEVAAPVPDQAAALVYFREGKQHYNERRYAEAAQAFDRSLAAAWSINAAYNKALSLDRASDLVAALQAYRDYLEHAETQDQHRVTALERSEQLRQRLGEVLLQVDSPEAIREIRINGDAVDKDAFPRLTLPGPLEVEFVGEAPGQRKHVRADVRAGGTVTIVFPGFVRPEVRPPDAVKPPARPFVPEESRRLKGLRAGFWTTTSLALAGGVTVAILGSRVLVARDRAHSGCDGLCEEGEKQGLYRTFFALQDATNVAIGVSAAVGVAALALGIALRRERARRPVSTRAALRWLGSTVELTF